MILFNTCTRRHDIGVMVVQNSDKLSNRLLWQRAQIRNVLQLPATTAPSWRIWQQMCRSLYSPFQTKRCPLVLKLCTPRIPFSRRPKNDDEQMLEWRWKRIDSITGWGQTLSSKWLMGESATYLLNVPSEIHRRSNPLPKQAAGNNLFGCRPPYTRGPSWSACSSSLMLENLARAV